MKKYFNRLKNAWIDSTILGKIVLIIYFPIWLLCGFNEYWDIK